MKKSKLSVQELRLIDAHGELRALLGTWRDNGLPFLTFFDSEQRPRATVGFDGTEKVHLSFQRKQGSTTVGIGEWADGTVFVGIYGAHGNPLIELSVDADERVHEVKPPTDATGDQVSG